MQTRTADLDAESEADSEAGLEADPPSSGQDGAAAVSQKTAQILGLRLCGRGTSFAEFHEQQRQLPPGGRGS